MGTEGMEGMESAAEEAVDPLEQITTIIGGLAGAEIFSQLADTLWDFADKAGTFEDSLMRARLEAEGAGISVNDMTDTVSELGRVTGRAGGEIREAFITATARGITDLDSFKQMMIGAGAQATLLGTDIDSMANKMSGLAMRSSVMERTLANTGITVEELGEALGIQGATIDDINAKWETMDTNQRAAALGMAASMNEGKTANEEYKKSWAGLQAQLDIAKGRLERLAGEVLLSGETTYSLDYDNYTIMVEATGFEDYSENIKFRANHKTFTIPLEATLCKVTVTAKDGNSNKLEDAVITLSKNSTTVASGTTDKDGVCVLEDIRFGTYTLAAVSDDETLAYTGSLTVDDDETATITLTAVEQQEGGK